MGQKVNPNAFRFGVVRGWNSNWYADRKDFRDFVQSDLKVREKLYKELSKAGISKIVIERPAKSLAISVHVARPGVVIGKKGEEIEQLESSIAAIAKVPAKIKVVEVKKPEADAQLIADSIAAQLEKRVLFRRAVKRAIQSAQRAGVQGIKISVGGRLNGAEIARTELYHEGRVPLQTLKVDLDYAVARATTTYGVIGIKVWVFNGDLVGKQVSEKLRSGSFASVNKPESQAKRFSFERGK